MWEAWLVLLSTNIRYIFVISIIVAKLIFLFFFINLVNLAFIPVFKDNEILFLDFHSLELHGSPTIGNISLIKPGY
jgi:hypothetical protein